MKSIKPRIAEGSESLWIDGVSAIKDLNEDFQILHQVMWIDFEDIHKGVEVREAFAGRIPAVGIARATSLTSNVDL